MKMWMDFFIFLVWVYYSYRFVQLLVKMKRKVIFPSTEEEWARVRAHPQKAMSPPIYSKQKTGIIFQSVILIFILIMLILNNGFDAYFYLTLYFILALTRAHDLFNMFAVLKDGLIVGNQFVAWGTIRSFEWVPIDINHRFYGFDVEANRGYELKVKRRLFSNHLIVTTDEMKERLTVLLNEQLQSSSSTR